MARPRTSRPSPRIRALWIASALCVATASAQQPGGAEQGWDTPAEPAPSDGGVATLFYQVQLLQDDLRQLRGLIEEQQHRIDRLVRDQRERYVDLDERLAQLQGQSPIGPGAPAPASPAANPAPTTEARAYSAALDTMRAGRTLPADQRAEAYERALGMFAALVEDYPNGQLTANAFYWQGEIRLYRKEHELARQAFAQLLNAFPDHGKVPDALYKIGVAHHRLGDSAEALRLMARVIDEFPDHSAARLARAYADELR